MQQYITVFAGTFENNYWDRAKYLDFICPFAGKHRFDIFNTVEGNKEVYLPI
ncbi:hypothetical protein DYBT9623_05304 [Dyadobacter sp. CECT 9623]|uniref:Uncharacterized protein n=1 Tax=Dyadobacter linearis TaxID=2823330 RepID=A0ABM8UYB2_9BACT|nr:hypothetical protein DYBT9623_05304 [Dyadobacter sp. CECT 9623]